MNAFKRPWILVLFLFPTCLSSCTDESIPVILDIESVAFNTRPSGKSTRTVQVVVIQGNSCYSFNHMQTSQSGKTLEITPWGQKQVGGMCREIYSTHTEDVGFSYFGPGVYKVIVYQANGSQVTATSSLH